MSTRAIVQAIPGRYGANDVWTGPHDTPASVDDHTDTPVLVAAVAHNAALEPGCANTFVAVTDAFATVPVNVSVANDQRR